MLIRPLSHLLKYVNELCKHLFAMYNIEVSLLFSFVSDVASFEEGEQLSIYL